MLSDFWWCQSKVTLRQFYQLHLFNFSLIGFLTGTAPSALAHFGSYCAKFTYCLAYVRDPFKARNFNSECTFAKLPSSSLT